MALTRKFLTALGLEQDKVDEIIQAHTETVDGLKEQRDALKSDAERLPEVQKELKGLKEKLAEKSEDEYEEKYNQLKEEFDAYKQEVVAEKEKANKTEAYTRLLKEANIPDKRIESVLRVSESEIDSIKFNEDGNVRDAENIKKKIAEEWSDFVVTKTQQGASTATPPSNKQGSTMTKEEIMAISDGEERRKAIAENPDLFGLSKEEEGD